MKSIIILLVFVVPNSLKGQLRIENGEYLEEYKDPNSFIYQTITREIGEGIKDALNEYSNVNVKILKLT